MEQSDTAADACLVDDATGLVYTHYDWSGERPVSASIVTGVSEATGKPHGEIEPLHRTVDTDALESIFRDRATGDRRNAGVVTVVHEGCLVRVHADGRVVVRAVA